MLLMKQVRSVALAKKTIFTAIFALTMGTSSFVKAQDATVPSYWSGFYIGAGGGAALLDTDIDTDIDARGRRERCVRFNRRTHECTRYRPIRRSGYRFSDSSSFDEEETNFFGTIQLGVNQQITNALVIGAFIDADKYIGDSSNFGVSTTTRRSRRGRHFQDINGSIDMDYSATVGARLGFLMNPNTLIYGLVGYTYLKLDSDLSLSAGRIDRRGRKHEVHNVGLSIPDELDGLTLGAGVETRIAKNMSLKFEYRYTDFGGESSSSPFSSTKKRGRGYRSFRNILRGNSSAGIDADLHTIRAVLVFKLNQQQ